MNSDGNRPAGIAEVAELVAAIAIALTLEQDARLRRDLRRSANCPDDQPLVLELPVGSACVQLLPDGTMSPVRMGDVRPISTLEELFVQHPSIRKRIEEAGARVSEAARATVLPVLFPGYLPSRDEYQRLARWTPLIERLAYRFCARAWGELDSWRITAQEEAAANVIWGETVLERYYALTHTVAHLTLLCSDRGARTWLAEMAQSFAWTNWTPTFPLVRERTVWLAAAAARSAGAFGSSVIDRYLDALSRARHVVKIFDALFGLVAIAHCDESETERIASQISFEWRASADRDLVGGELVDIAFRSADSALRRRQDVTAIDTALVRRLSWEPDSQNGLSTRQAFRLDPTDIDQHGEMIGFGMLPLVLSRTHSFHYPLRPGASATLLPTLDEMPALLARAWGVDARVSQAVH